GGKATGRRVETATGRLRDADEPARKADAVRVDAADSPISRGRGVRFGLLRLRRELVLRDAARGAIAGGSGEHCQRAGIPAHASGTGGSDWPGGAARRGAGIPGDNVDGGEPCAVPRAAAGEAGHGHFHGADYVCGGVEYFGGAFDDGDGSREGYRGVALDGSAARTDPAHFFVPGDCHWRDGNCSGTDDRVWVQLDCGELSPDSAGSPGLCGAVRAVPRQFSGWNVDRRGGDGNCGRCDVAAGEGGVAAAAGGDS